MIMNSYIIKLLLVFFLLIFSWIPVSYAQTIPITISSNMNKIVFDGKWTFEEEWKSSSLNEVDTPSGSLYIRTAHQDDFIYVFIDAAMDTHPDFGSDRATICFDLNNNKSNVTSSRDYCFLVALGGNSTFSLQGGSPLTITDNFKRIPAPHGFIGIGGISDIHDIYGQIPHPSYEFRIPKEFLGNSDSYGFFVQFYDASSNKFYSWPQTQNGTYYSHIPSPNNWGELISPDHTLPEFSLPPISLLFSFITAIYFIKFRIKIDK